MTKTTSPLLVSLLFHGALLAVPTAILSSPKSLHPPLLLQVTLLPTQTATISPLLASTARLPPTTAPLRQPSHSPASLTTLSDSGYRPTAARTPSDSATVTPSPVAPSSPLSSEATTALPPPSVRPVEDDNALTRYGQRLSEWLAKQQHYPRLAEMRGWEGEVRLQLRIARKGALIDVQVSRSSGHDILDRNALQLVQESPLPPLPAGFGQSSEEEIRITVPIHYRLGKRTS